MTAERDTVRRCEFSCTRLGSMFEQTTTIEIDGLRVDVKRRPGSSTYDVTLPDGQDGPGGFSIDFFPEGDQVNEDTLREEIARNVVALTSDPE